MISGETTGEEAAACIIFLLSRYSPIYEAFSLTDFCNPIGIKARKARRFYEKLKANHTVLLANIIPEDNINRITLK